MIILKLYENKETSKGIFWEIDGDILAFPFYGDSPTYYNGIAKSGDTYNHKRLWNDIKPRGCNKPYNYYPRGRVEITNSGKVIIYANPNISNFADIYREFGIIDEPIINYDYSSHYKCHLDAGWKPEK